MSLMLAIVGCSKANDSAKKASSEVKKEAAEMTKNQMAADKAKTKAKEAVAEIVDEPEMTVDTSSGKTYFDGYVAGALKTVKTTAECQGARDTIANVLAQYKAGNVAQAAAVDRVQETLTAQKGCML